MKRIAIAAFAASLSVVSFSSAAEAKDAQIVVSGPSSQQEWVNAANQNLDRALDDVSLRNVQSGITVVRFQCGENGSPTDIATIERGNRNLASVGRKAVKRMNLHPHYPGATEDQIYEAVIIVADSRAHLAELRRRVAARNERQRDYWAARGVPNPVVTLALVGAM
jgi:hypothetical protein